MFLLTGKKAIVTGAAQELGYAIAKELHDVGIELVIMDISDKASKVAGKMSAHGEKEHVFKTNLLDEQNFHNGFEKL